MSFITPKVENLGLTSAEQTDLVSLFGNNQISRVLIGVKKSTNMNSTADQAITINLPSYATKYIVRSIIVTNPSISLTTAVGGFYAAASKTTTLVAATQAYSALTAATKILDVTLGALLGTDSRTETTLYISLTTAQGAAATADIYIYADLLP